MPIAYTQNNKTLVAHIASDITPAQAAIIMNLPDGTWWEITEQEAEELQKPEPPTEEEVKQSKINAFLQGYAEAMIEANPDADAVELGRAFANDNMIAREIEPELKLKG